MALDATRALLIMGPSGSGKSSLALALMALGARLVSDDRTLLRRDAEGQALMASAPEAIAGLIEARGLGLLAADPLPEARLCGLVDLAATEAERLPEPREHVLIGVPIPLIRRVDGPHFAPALIQWLKGGRRA
ncbi:Hpr(Ser) kinase/phosphatase [Celeribacter indicus]|uniref:Hpr(Ser) kinase/phosphatase n=1 Tax=Celeribacter indicus TaxID=1208324 RepID=A0A0B5DYP1_9RHOB|nr:Hpr(Ser) kinase/phosphatase [Celeribacter indicus]